MLCHSTEWKLRCAWLCSRPKSVNEVAHQEEVVQTLDKALQGSNVRGWQLHRALRTVAVALEPCAACSCRTFYSMGLLARARPPQLWPLHASCMGTPQVRTPVQHQ